MANINLVTDGVQSKPGLSYRKGMTGIIALLLLVLGAYAVISYMDNAALKKTESAGEEIVVQKQKLKNENSTNVFDYGVRSNVASNLLADSSNPIDGLVELEKLVVPGVYFDSYSMDDQQKTIQLNGVADNFNLVAKQIYNLKKSEYFSEVTAGESKVNEQGKIGFFLKLKIK